MRATETISEYRCRDINCPGWRGFLGPWVKQFKGEKPSSVLPCRYCGKPAQRKTGERPCESVASQLKKGGIPAQNRYLLKIAEAEGSLSERDLKLWKRLLKEDEAVHTMTDDDRRELDEVQRQADLEEEKNPPRRPVTDRQAVEAARAVGLIKENDRSELTGPRV